MLSRLCFALSLALLSLLAQAAETPADTFKKILPAINFLLFGEQTIELTITSPSEGASTTNSSINVAGTVKGPAGLTIQATSSGAGGTFNGSITGNPNSSAGATYTISNVALGMGSNTLTVTASHSGQSTQQKTVTVNRLALPTVQITSPTDGAILEASPVTVTGTFTDATSITVNGQAATLDSPAAGQFTASGITLTGSANGTVNAITATAVRLDGQAVHSVSVTYVTDPRVEWPLAIAAAASYEVFARWVVVAGNSTGATFTVHHAGGATEVVRDQTTSSAQWVSLGTFNLAPASNHRVELRPTGGQVVADAVRVVGHYAAEPSLSYVHADHLDTPRLVSNQAGQAVWSWPNDDAFGANAPNENPSGLGAFEFNFCFPGQYRDKETGLCYNYQRDAYDSGIGRYTQPEPIGLAGDINLYRYARNNPLSFIDPDGAQPIAPPRGVSVSPPGGPSSGVGPGASPENTVPIPGSRERPMERPGRPGSVPLQSSMTVAAEAAGKAAADDLEKENVCPPGTGGGSEACRQIARQCNAKCIDRWLRARDAGKEGSSWISVCTNVCASRFGCGTYFKR